MGVQVCEQSKQKKMELNTNIQLVMNSFGHFSLTVNIIPDISLTCFKFPDIFRFSRQVVTLYITTAALGWPL